MPGTQINTFFHRNILYKKKKLLMTTLTNEIKPVVSLKYEFEYRKNLVLICFLRNFRTIRILIQANKIMIFSRNNLSPSAVFPVEILLEEIELAVAEN